MNQEEITVYENNISELREKLKLYIKRNSAEGILFSGGLDSSILSFFDPDMKAITVSLDSSGEDINYSKKAVEFLNLKHYRRDIKIEEAIGSIPEVIKILKTFDPAIPNDLAVYFGLRLAKELGISKVMTGDGADELFAGYSFMRKINDLDSYIRRISQNMKFSSNFIGGFFGIQIVQPFLYNEVIDIALSIDPDLKLREHDGKLCGKWILRKAFEYVLPGDIVWQDKRPLEVGSGMTKLREIISSKISDKEFQQESKLNKVKFMNKEHLYYYRLYKDAVGVIPEPLDGENQCPGCGAGIKKDAFHCQVCGWTGDWRRIPYILNS